MIVMGLLQGSFNHFASHFTFAWGINTILDPILIAIIDIIYGRWNANGTHLRVSFTATILIVDS